MDLTDRCVPYRGLYMTERCSWSLAIHLPCIDYARHFVLRCMLSGKWCISKMSVSTVIGHDCPRPKSGGMGL